MDWLMPEMDGYEAKRFIRDGDGGEKYRGIPINAMTYNAIQGDREKFLSSGNYLSKTINLGYWNEF